MKTEQSDETEWQPFPFIARQSASPGQVVGNFGVTQDFSVYGRRITAGVAMVSAAGAGLDVVHVQESNGTASTFEVLEVIPSIGIDLTDRLSVGAGFGAARSTLDGILVGESKNTLDYAVRATFGVNYKLASCRSVGAYCHTKERFTFHDAVTLELFHGRHALSEDIKLELPTSVGIFWKPILPRNRTRPSHRLFSTNRTGILSTPLTATHLTITRQSDGLRRCLRGFGRSARCAADHV